MITQHQSSMREYSSCLAARGLIFNGRPGGNSSNSSSVGRGWRPLHKPQWFDVNKKVIISKLYGGEKSKEEGPL